MIERTAKGIPSALYAAAGAGDLAYEKLRQLPDMLSELSGRAPELRERAREKTGATMRTANDTAVRLRARATGLRLRAGEVDGDRLREMARRNATAMAGGAFAIGERAAAAYGALVARGERVVATRVPAAAPATVATKVESTTKVETAALPADRASETARAVHEASKAAAAASTAAEESADVALEGAETSVTGTEAAETSEETSSATKGAAIQAGRATARTTRPASRPGNRPGPVTGQE